jgi:hypothetical protein
MSYISQDPEILTKDGYRYATEHIYEKNWLSIFMDENYKNYFAGVTDAETLSKVKYCNGAGDVLDLGPGTQSDGPAPVNDYSAALMQKLMTDWNYRQLATILPFSENSMKYRVSTT